MQDELTDTLVARELAARSMEHTDPVVQRALATLGQPINPVRVLDTDQARDLYAKYGRVPSREMVAFRAPGDQSDPHIYVNRDARMFREAQRDPLAQLLFAATLAHEQVHNTDGETAARRIESDFLRSRVNTVPHAHRAALKNRIAALEHLTK